MPLCQAYPSLTKVPRLPAQTQSYHSEGMIFGIAVRSQSASKIGFQTRKYSCSTYNFIYQPKAQTLMSTKFRNQRVHQYRLLQPIGEGVSSVVYQAHDEAHNRQVAIKIMPQKLVNQSQKHQRLAKNQIEVLRKCHSENIIEFYESFQTESNLCIVTELCNGGTLDDYVRKRGSVPQAQAVVLLKQIINGLKALHQAKAMHRDFKPSNILLHNGVCKLADLGFSILLEQGQTSQEGIGTLNTMAPEVLSQAPYSFKADIWSLGVVFYKILFNAYPYRGLCDVEVLKNIKKSLIKFDKASVSLNAINFIQRCLTVSVRDRIGWQEIARHPLICENNPLTIQPIRLKSVLGYEPTHRASSESAQQLPLEILINQEDLLQRKSKMNRTSLDQQNNAFMNRKKEISFASRFVLPNLRELPEKQTEMEMLLLKNQYHALKQYREEMKTKIRAMPGQHILKDQEAVLRALDGDMADIATRFETLKRQHRSLLPELSSLQQKQPSFNAKIVQAAQKLLEKLKGRRLFQSNSQEGQNSKLSLGLQYFTQKKGLNLMCQEFQSKQNRNSQKMNQSKPEPFSLGKFVF